MLFRDLKIGDRFRFDGRSYQKISEAVARRNGAELVFSQNCPVEILGDRPINTLPMSLK